jgi:thioredoxin 1
MIKLLIIILVGAGAGALLGSTRSCESGGCPLTATPLRGAIYGAVMAGLIGLALVGLPRRSQGGPSTESPAALSAHLVAVSSSAEFEAEVLQAKGPVLVDFYADWCGPCKRLAPVLSELADEWVGTAKVVKVNVDKASDVAKTYSVSSIPDVRLFLDGQQKEQWVGLQDKSVYQAGVAKLQATAPPAAPPTKAE